MLVAIINFIQLEIFASLLIIGMLVTMVLHMAIECCECQNSAATFVEFKEVFQFEGVELKLLLIKLIQNFTGIAKMQIQYFFQFERVEVHINPKIQSTFFRL